MTINNETELRAALRRLSSFFSAQREGAVRAVDVLEVTDAVVDYASRSSAFVPPDVLSELENDARRAALVMFAAGVAETVNNIAAAQVFGEPS